MKLTCRTKVFRKLRFIFNDKIDLNTTFFAVTLRECRYYNREIFLCQRQKWAKIVNILKRRISKGNCILARQTIYVWKKVYFLLTVFIWSSVLKKFKEDSYGPKYTISILSLSEKKRHTNLQM